VSQLYGRLTEPIYTGGIIFEVVASHNRWIWHALFGVAYCNNDINVLNQSLLFVDIIRGHTPKVSFIVNGHEHHM
jgi:hypothetical protein